MLMAMSLVVLQPLRPYNTVLMLFVIGSHVWTDRSFYEGSIDNFNFWNKDLSQSEIQSTMNNGLSGNEKGLVGYWNFNEGNGNVLTDLSANGNDGTIFGASWVEVAGSNGVFTYSPNYNFYGSDSFTYTVSDGSATSEEATVSITINSVIDKYYVSSTGSDDNNGSSNNPFVTIQAGINAAENSDTVFVAAGTYTENINFNGKNIYLKVLQLQQQLLMVERTGVLFKQLAAKDQAQH